MNTQYSPVIAPMKKSPISAIAKKPIANTLISYYVKLFELYKLFDI